MSFTTIIYAHPYEQSFNHAILQRVRELLESKGEAYKLIDLYADGFNPAYTKEELALFNQGKALDPLVLHYQEILKKTDRLIFIFPIWWADMPAIVKGFEDKVFLKTLAYNPTPTGIKGCLTQIREAVVITTSTAPTWYLKFFCGNVIGKTMIGHTLKGIGVGSGRWINFGGMDKSTAQARQSFLDKLSDKLYLSKFYLQ
ncbi:NAD(P)H-dependent oxidoreductase [Aggregatibacter aphrophilus]|uniref:NADPH-quinone reductase (Modulator of drug activity B) n=3 Tax=Aggregatibacter aphrophilus TaxID=732 RepID=A0A336N7L4_AGGAP|nr:NAD(P)H-dependent oxidoreductase [Aggregatibacter aphrophilus]KNE84455.1 NAD(P)H dehydrogenase [Aggregatibacter aphrophilus ATCC 33389]OBY50607.1 NAD(P)H dehydrogenase [Aggregatibacter aphrophilus]RDE88630.1 flavodoxin family protein [Aggregatibacter aphrophilus]SSZ30211.1 Putative NADPH-quinone reductase (modulator of drug activity B) [Aggregatibacter aphrophilus]VEF42689.1 Putative NADPH-quinone reductase (modulator of drug activity B) [Aggregatibacter aphrophilus ATCC 33389]